MNKFKFPKFHLLDDDETGRIPHGNLTYIIAFLIPLIMFIALYYVREIYPFGTNCYLRSDMYHQYAPFFSELWDKLRNGGSLTYSWDIGMGTNFTALYAYYLASPSNWLIFLFPQKNTIEIMNAFIIIKSALASVTFTYYISRHFHTKSCIIALFGMFYAMSGFVAAYSWNIMWLDCLILLPLIMLGLERLVNENKCLLYCISLGLCIYTNYYISIMVCMSVILYFVVLMVAYKGNRHPQIYLKKLLHWGFYSLLAGGLAACLLLPEMYAFSLSASSNTTFPQTLTNYFSIISMLVRQLINVPVHLGLDHYPNIYCGVAVFLLLPLYVMNSKVCTREKVGKCIMLLVFLTAFNLNIPNYIWHGFHFPNSLPCRQSFIYDFFLLVMCFEGFKDCREYSNKQFAGAFWIAIGIFLVMEQTALGDQYQWYIVYLSAAFILAYGLIMLIHRNLKHSSAVLLFFVFAVSIVECTVNMESTGLSTTGRTAYLLDYDAVENVTDTVAAQDNGFYRIEKTYGLRSKNDSAWHNYRGISTFSSTSPAGISTLLGSFGCEHSTNAYGYNGATLVTSSIFNVKYIISNKILTESSLFQYYYGHDGELLYRNNYTLPVGFMVNSNIEDEWRTASQYNGIQVQNYFIETNTGIKDVFVQDYEFRTDTDVTFNPNGDGHLYAVIRNSTLDSVGVSINGTVTNYTGLKNDSRILDLGYVNSTDNVNIYGDSTLNALIYRLDESKFIRAFNILNAGGLNVTDHTDTSITGDINVGTEGIMFFSIPYDAGWTVKVDGKQVNTFAIKEATLGIQLTAGAHHIELNYYPVNLTKGILITLLSILILILICLFRKMQHDKRLRITALPLWLQNLLNEKDMITSVPSIPVKKDSHSEAQEGKNTLQQ